MSDNNKDKIVEKIEKIQDGESVHFDNSELRNIDVDINNENVEETISKKVIVKNVIWNIIEKYSNQIVLFVISLIMARLLSPADYGILGMTTLFISLATTFIDSGFGLSLIQKKNCTAKDFSTIFYFNILISIFSFLILYASAPFIADFYNQQILRPVIRVLGFSIVIGSFGAVAGTILTKELKFKNKAIITLLCSIFSGIIGVVLAYNGFGIWALVAQTISSASLRVILVFVFSRWKPMFSFSKESFHQLFNFGSKILVSNLLYVFFQNIYSITIGKWFTPSDLGYFSRASSYSKLIPDNISGVIASVLLPVLSKIQDDDKQLLHISYKLTSITSALIFPLMFLMVGTAYPLISVMITDKWLPCVPLLQILCITSIFDHLTNINNQLVLAKGRSDLILKMQWYTKGAALLILIVTVFGGLYWVAIGKGISTLYYVAYTYYNAKQVIQISIKQIFRQIYIPLIISVILGLISYVSFIYLSYTLINLLIVGVLFISLYLVCVKITSPTTINELIRIKN